MSLSTCHKTQLQDIKYNNWVKGGLALKYLKDGIGDFSNEIAREEHSQILKTIGLPPGTICNGCTLKTLKPSHAPPQKVKQCPNGQRNCNCLLSNTSSCPKNICGLIFDELVKSHGTLQPFWKNTDITKWTTHPWEIAKCFINIPGYDGKQSANDTDITGLLHLFINCTFFQRHVSCAINLFDKIREWRNSVFHSASMELEDQQLIGGINDIITLLEDEKELKGKEYSRQAVINLKLLQQGTFIITTETEAEVCRAALASITQETMELKHIKDEATKDIELKKEEAKQCIDMKQEEVLKKVQETTETEITEVKSELCKLRTRVDNHDSEINILQKKVKDIDNDVAKLKEAHEHQKKHLQEIERRKSLKEDLITYYRDKESQIPAAPLVEEHKVALEDLYVIPPMWAYGNPYYYAPENDIRKQHKKSESAVPTTHIATIDKLFLSDKNVRYKNIYITANAGLGKTSLSQKLTMTWCQTHLPLVSLTEKYGGDELEAMKYFDFLFLLHLRDYQTEPLCNLDDLIMQMVLENLSRSTLYTKEFLQIVLHEKKCVIILDGLDEWAHPEKCKKTPLVPHNNHPDSCTVLTTSRPWKLGTIELSEHNIDRHVEILELDWFTRSKLEENAVRILNQRNLNLAGKTIYEFHEEVRSVEIGGIFYIPYILLQLICLFFGGLPIGKSKCLIYSNITEFILARGLRKKNFSNINLPISNDISPVPNCMKENDTCNLYFGLLTKLGKLAFYTLFSEKKESSLIFDRTVVTQYMTEQEIEFCLKVGLLCQTKDNRIIAVKRHTVFFQHKSVQEFFSAIYITSEWQNENIKSIFLKVCSSLSDTLEMENVFVFVCGINPKVYSSISVYIQEIVDRDQVTQQYRADMNINIDNDDSKKIKSYQSMQVLCLQESVRNGNDYRYDPIHLHDILIDNNLNKKRLGYFSISSRSDEDKLKTLKVIIQLYKNNAKSLQLSYQEEEDFLQFLDPSVFTSLETLKASQKEDYGICSSYRGPEPVWLANILTQSARTLKCLTLLYERETHYHNFNASLTAFESMTCLQSLYLQHIGMPHSNINCLNAYLNKTTVLTKLKLVLLMCDDHWWFSKNGKCDAILNLHRMNRMKMLKLCGVEYRELHLNPTCLEELKLKLFDMTASTNATLWQGLRGAPVLSSLTLEDKSSCEEMIQTITTSTHLQYIKLLKINLGDIGLPFSPAMTKLECVKLEQVTMSYAAWKELFVVFGKLPRTLNALLSRITMTSQEWRDLLRSVGSYRKTVTVKLHCCEGPSKVEWQTIIDEIKSHPKLSLGRDLYISSSPNGQTFYGNFSLKSGV